MQLSLFDDPNPIVMVVYYDYPYNKYGYKDYSRVVTWSESARLDVVQSWIQLKIIKHYKIYK